MPDPSATIPDFGPRPDIKVKKEEAKVSRTPDGDVAIDPSEEKTEVDPPKSQPAKSGMNPMTLGIIGLLVAILAGGLGFFVVVFVGLLMFFILGN